MARTPKELGFSMPAEWEKHSVVWLAWPHDDTTFPGLVPLVEEKYCEIIKSLEGSDRVNLIVLGEDKERIEKKLLDYGINSNHVHFFIEDYADVWTRDYAPITLINKGDNKKAFIKWGYNAYGKSNDPFFSDLLKDNNVFLDVLDKKEETVFRPEFILEGGAIESNGNGTIMTTKQCLLNPNRNGPLKQEDVEKYLEDYLGAENFIWLEDGLINDHTDGHIDEIARFVSKDTIVCAYEDNESDSNFNILDKNFKILENSTDKDGNKFKIIKLPMPHMDYDNGEKAPVSYANFLIGNSVVIMALFNDPNDEKAKSIIQSVFPGYKVVGIDCSKIIYGGGAIHCMTMQETGVN